jgi:hypothetical protein
MRHDAYLDYSLFRKHEHRPAARVSRHLEVEMFCVSVVDHVRLNFGHVVRNYSVHAEAAERMSALALKLRLTVLALLGLATAAMVLSLFSTGRGYQIAAAVIAGLALAGHIVYVAIGVESRVYSHRLFAHRLWVMCERYRSLLAEIQDGLIDDAAILRRRDALIEQVHATYEQGFSVDQPAHEATRQLAVGNEPAAISEQQIDRFLPASVRKAADARSPAADVQH